ncbi:MAG: DNA ligase D [Burkholderiaceae bacterium]|nr:DNA ligase D [Burkholderiaceae bacterium]
MPPTDPLQRYRAKRDFRVTREPPGERSGQPPGERSDQPPAERSDPPPGERPARTPRQRAGRTSTGRAAKHEEAAVERSFVVQKHAARRLHYDFRLELDGALASWAVPKGPSLDPKVKRMAVHVEDHPLEYADFEGTIPPKQYGAGTVIVWDRGTWLPEGDPHAAYRDGKLKFELRGEKLRGRWTLVRMHGHGDERQEPWLLIKERDGFARPEDDYSIVDALPGSVLQPREETSSMPAQARKAPLPDALEPQLATLVEAAPTSGVWSWEMKFDGYRLLARVADGDVRLITRNGNDWTQRMPSLARAVAALGLRSAWLDGEIVLADADAVPDFQQLQNAFDSARTDDIVYYLFDLPFFAGHDLRKVPLHERRALLRAWLAEHPSERIRFSEDFRAPPEDLLRSACELGMEGLIGKRTDSAYVGRRSPSWIKLKCTNRQEFVVGGYTEPQGSRSGFGALLLGVYDDEGSLRYAGKVGSGFDESRLRALSARLQALATQGSPFAQRVRERGAHWVRPELVAEVSFTQWTTDGRIRHPVFRGLRDDKPASAIRRERASDDAAVAAQARPPDPRIDRLLARVRVSNPQRIIDASSGITKLELVRHYALVAPSMMPHLQRRPVALVRAPDGIDGQRFFQKHASTSAMPGVRSFDPKYDPGEEPLIGIAGEKGLVTAAQMNMVELHTWNATTRAIEKPDRMIFDLDPGEGVQFAAVREAARLVHALLDELGLASFVKTSGGKGLHVVVPISPKHGWNTVKGLSRAIVVHLARTLPDRFVAKSGPSNRKGRIFADYLRNGRGATTVAAWSARARPGIGVSVPLSWDELPAVTSGAQWTLRDVEARLATPDPWAAYATTRQTIDAAMRALDFAAVRE